MKKRNPNGFVFVFAAVFVIAGLCGAGAKNLMWSVSDLAAQLKHGNIFGFLDLKVQVDSITEKDLCYHHWMMDLHSLKENLLGTRVVQKDDMDVVKSNDGSLSSYLKSPDGYEVEKSSAQVLKLKELAEQNGAKFLYCAVPLKENYLDYPSNITSAHKTVYEQLIDSLSARDIPYYDFAEMFAEEHLSADEIYYYTDHHWRSEIGFAAAGRICEELRARYGFAYDPAYTDLQSYSIRTYPDIFLGSYGKKVGTYFTWRGADDFDLITPDFETRFTESRPNKNEERTGSFTDALLFPKNLEKNRYGRIAYNVYCGGDYRLQILHNHLNENGKKILLIKDSFAAVFAPFLALQTGDLYLVDVRSSDAYAGEKLNMETFIPQIQPDYVLVLYSGVTKWTDTHELWNFF